MREDEEGFGAEELQAGQVWTGPKSVPNSTDLGREGEKGDRGERNSGMEGGLGPPLAAQAASRLAQHTLQHGPRLPARGPRRAPLTEDPTRPAEHFLSVYLSHTDSERVSEPHRQRAGERDLGCSGGRQFCSFFYAFEIKEMSRSFQNRGRKPGGTYCRVVNEVACSLQEGYRLVQRRVKPEAQQQRALA